jgi:hypothetical protein
MVKLPAILAFDPGGKTGWCSYDVETPSRGNIEECDLQRGQFEGDDYHQKLFDFLIKAAETRIIAPLHIVCERFQFRKDEQYRDKIDYKAVEYIGVIRLFAKIYRNSGVRLIEQGAAQACGETAFFGDNKKAPYGGNERLKELGLWLPGQPHAMDATRHYAYYRTFTLKDQTYLHALR